MDILAARKKAAEKAKSRQNPEPAESPLPPSMPVEETPHHAEAEPPPSAEIPELPAVEGAATALHEEAERAGHADAADAEQAAAREIELLSFRLGGEEYAVMVDDVREVLKLRDLTPVPNAAEYILGVTSLRGTMLPVVDLCKRLGLTPGVRDDKSRIIVVNPGEEDVGLMVDRVTGVARTTLDAIKPAPEHIEQGAEFLRGIVRRDEKLYILLDLQKAVGV